MLRYPRVPCRITGCKRDIPASPGFMPDRLCWRHDYRHAAPWTIPRDGAWAERVDEVLVGAEGRWAA
jgi:hypothetical protein